jgi:hypothetical protein
MRHIASDVIEVIDELREISRGIYPASLSRGSLASAVRVLARRSSIPVELDIHTEAVFRESAQAACYYVVAEALTNSAKHGSARMARVTLIEREGMPPGPPVDAAPASSRSLSRRKLTGAALRVWRMTSGRMTLPIPPASYSIVNVTRERAPSPSGSTVRAASGRIGPFTARAAQRCGGATSLTSWTRRCSAPAKRRMLVNRDPTVRGSPSISTPDDVTLPLREARRIGGVAEDVLRRSIDLDGDHDRGHGSHLPSGVTSTVDQIAPGYVGDTRVSPVYAGGSCDLGDQDRPLPL